MRVVMSLRNLSLGLATASFLLAASALAQTPSPQSGQWKLNGVNARLDRTLDARSARVGQTVEVKLDRAVKTAAGAKLPGGTEVCGTVESVQASQNGSPSTVTLRFTTARLENGQKVPVKVTVIGAFPPNAQSYLNSMGGQLPPAPAHISPQDRFTQEPGLLRHIEMKSAVQGQNSATFTNENGNVRLGQGTYLQLAIAPVNNGQQNGM